MKTPSGQVAVSYSKDVADVLAGKCVGCHSDALAENKLNMEEVAGMLKGGKRGPAIVPGNADDSLLYKAVRREGELQMPPGKNPLTTAELAAIRDWINDGAKWTGQSAKAASSTFPSKTSSQTPSSREGRLIRRRSKSWFPLSNRPVCYSRSWFVRLQAGMAPTSSSRGSAGCALASSLGGSGSRRCNAMPMTARS